MHYIKSLLLIAVIALTTVSCTKPGTELPYTQLVGEWQWVRSDGGIANLIHDTPASTGKNVTLKLTADNQYFFYSNGSLASQGTYTLETRACIHDGQQKTLINFSGCPDQAIHLLNATTLELSDEAHDGIGSQYRRAIVSIK